ncbi:MAG: CapA family protein [Kribbellaceae bacterium]
MAHARDGLLTLFLGGDVMLGRGVDQILPNPGDPALRERFVGDARVYIELAEAANGRIPRPVDFAWPWGDALAALDEAAPDVRVVNLETSVTRAGDFAPGKAVHYRMSPANLGSLAVARPNACALANNHVLDFGSPGLEETLAALAGTGLPAAGAGLTMTQARQPVAVAVEGRGRVLVFAFGMVSSGIPPGWAATDERPGVHLVPEPSTAAAEQIAEAVRQAKEPGDVAVASIHWGSNWGYDVVRDQVRFAHQLIDGGIDVVHGHSSHHPRPIEVYRNRLILYGCGDLIDDYEGIHGHDEYRDDLRLLYLVSLESSVERDTGALVGLRMAPLQPRQMRLRHASRPDCEWLAEVISRVSRRFGTRVDALSDGTLALRRS